MKKIGFVLCCIMISFSLNAQQILNLAPSVEKLVKIDGQNISSQVLINGITDKEILRSFLFVNDNSIFVSCVGKALMIDKININI